jgi:hypothetical protein
MHTSSYPVGRRKHDPPGSQAVRASAPLTQRIASRSLMQVRTDQPA